MWFSKINRGNFRVFVGIDIVVDFDGVEDNDKVGFVEVVRYV